MRGEDLAKLYKMQPHEENGSFVERHYLAAGQKRADSGAIYYFLGNKEKALFHQIDCDEYWAYVTGADLELWLVTDGKLQKQILGLGQGKEPLIYIPKGTIFGAKHLADAEDGTFLSCITVPRFEYQGWRLVELDEIVKINPLTGDFFA
ncbi:MAG: cupin domain-containing protein [Acidaminococcaceae bacterium]|nr:cupin domain-containing protein [Acidaminococcaceae bacterium]